MKIAIIGGSGAEHVIQALNHDLTNYEALRGTFPDSVCRIFVNGDKQIMFFYRHGIDGNRSPASVDPTEIVSTLETHIKPGEPHLIIQTSASGSLDETIKLVDEGGIVVCSDVMRGFAFQTPSFGGAGGREMHAVMKDAYNRPEVRRLALDAIAKVPGATAYDGGIYVNDQGNQFETPAEIAALVAWLDFYETTLLGLRATKEMVLKSLDDITFSTGSPEKKEESRKPFNQFLEGCRQKMALYERLSQNLNRRHATVSMNAGRELPLLVECGYKNIMLLSVPTNYGVGLVPDEKVDHERTKQAIAKAAPLYIAPTLVNMIRMADQYIR